MACAGDVPTLETLAAVTALREQIPDLRVRVVNMSISCVWVTSSEHPHGLADRDFAELFTCDKPVIFAFHGYPALIHNSPITRKSRNFHVQAIRRKGRRQRPLDMVV